MNDRASGTGPSVDPENAKRKETPNKGLSENFAPAVKEALVRRGISQAEMAEKIGLSQAGFNHLLSNRSQFDLYQGYVLAETLGLDIRDYLPAEKRLSLPVTSPAKPRPTTNLEREHFYTCYTFVQKQLELLNQTRAERVVGLIAAKMAHDLSVTDTFDLTDTAAQTARLAQAFNVALLEYIPR